MSFLAMQGAVATITIKNEGVRNALDNATRLALLSAFREATADPECAAIVLTGADGNFCAGGELTSIPQDEIGIRQRLGEAHEIVRMIHAGPKPVVAAVDGVAFGSGISFVAACDYVIATNEARFGCSFGRMGLIADAGLLWTLPRRIGWPSARLTLLENRQMNAENAHQLGLVDELTSSTELLIRANAWASAFKDSAPLALAATKRILAYEGGSGFDDLLAAEVNEQVRLLTSDDFNEGRTAFYEKRPAAFRTVRPSKS